LVVGDDGKVDFLEDYLVLAIAAELVLAPPGGKAGGKVE